ncbi:vitamin K-dependent gamma-carboxylase-like protein [Promicromonospora sp. AC04]|uniref:HTTM domain-containing protein n=1 Tax=Promicromonospora sp. AC04 TaxID=2135723 RepID=UPI000D35475B|nr:HTTM domain-containing protein [Promicromonospora sp. AC04]PUB26992.1 vitamin K-dependent gamma-carboxylase-like protein [Promicromonospora sp. AC04]
MTRLLDVGVRWMIASAHATYGVALMRIVFGLGIGGYVAVNFSARQALWGTGARWTTPLGGHALASGPLLTAGCVALLLVAVLVTVGWRARWTVPLLVLGWTGLTAINPLVADQGDNISRILLVYLCFADTSARWSLDARRRGSGAGLPASALTASARPRPARTQVRNLLHNAAVLAVGAQICLAYVLSGLFKLHGTEWREGTAVYYPLMLPQFRPWPPLADLVAGSGWLVAAVTWGTLALQLAFPLLLLQRHLRVAGVAGALAMHAGIAVIMGLPFFSLFMMAGDCVFLRDATIARWRHQPPERTG